MAAFSLIFCDFPPSDRPEASKIDWPFSVARPPQRFHTTKARSCPWRPPGILRRRGRTFTGWIAPASPGAP